ncbi:hypothetical protein CEXT_65571, partial [Caerostris extrusa]
MKQMSHKKKVKYMRKFGWANSAENKKIRQEIRQESIKNASLLPSTDFPIETKTKEKTITDDPVSESEVKYICSVRRNKHNSSESRLMKHISGEREKKMKQISHMQDLRELEDCFLENQEVFENNLRVIEAKAAEKRSEKQTEKKSIRCEKCNKDVTRGRKLLREEPGNCICKEYNQDVGSCKRKETGRKRLLQEPEPNQEVDSCKRKKTRGRKALLKEPEPNQEVDSCKSKKTRGRKAVLKEPEPNKDVDSCKRKKTSGSKGLLIAP